MDNITAKAETIVRAAPIEVFDAFVNAGKMSKFWFTRRDEGLREGETMSWFVGNAKDAYAFEVRVMEIKKPELINRLEIPRTLQPCALADSGCKGRVFEIDN